MLKYSSYDLGQYVCHNFMASAQFFSFSKDYELRREDGCATVTNPFPGRQEKVEMSTCHGQGRDQEWAHTKVSSTRHHVVIRYLTSPSISGWKDHSQTHQDVPGCR